MAKVLFAALINALAQFPLLGVYSYTQETKKAEEAKKAEEIKAAELEEAGDVSADDMVSKATAVRHVCGSVLSSWLGRYFQVWRLSSNWKILLGCRDVVPLPQWPA